MASWLLSNLIGEVRLGFCGRQMACDARRTLELSLGMALEASSAYRTLP